MKAGIFAVLMLGMMTQAIRIDPEDKHDADPKEVDPKDVDPVDVDPKDEEISL